MAEKKPGKRALRAQAAARRAELEPRLVDLLRALGLGASRAPELLALAKSGELEALRKQLGEYAANTEGDHRRRREAEGLLLELTALTEA